MTRYYSENELKRRYDIQLRLREARTPKPHRIYTAHDATDRMGACVRLARLRIISGSDTMAGAHATEAAHLGLMLLEPGIIRRHITPGCAVDDMVDR